MGLVEPDQYTLSLTTLRVAQGAVEMTYHPPANLLEARRALAEPAQLSAEGERFAQPQSRDVVSHANKLGDSSIVSNTIATGLACRSSGPTGSAAAICEWARHAA